ncbi:hypothetical protein M2139_002816 [Enterococcus sp. PF1-24]|uniref:MucBP domain-containing protein n=1 Tax=unclassified Enterococcus TaxID=2608891 RepID=UPI0024742BFD|nr:MULTISPECIES: MucBP domain-containing protein [unclassified Enterococcus]MDH6365781.1 hypothetical protein [Enterococcus sp. PFB1-1]MDH6402886.1 hypothetical protein [Enterococcus sp. PF1-24]
MNPTLMIWMPDSNLQQFILEYFGLESTDEITQELLEDEAFYLNYQDLLEVKNFKGLEYANFIHLKLYPTIEDDGPYFPVFELIKDPILRAKTDLEYSYPINYLFTSGIDFSQFAGYRNVHIDPYSDSLYTDYVVSLDQNNYKSFFISYEDLGLHNFSPSLIIQDDSSMMIEIKDENYQSENPLYYVATPLETGFQFDFAEAESVNFDYSQIAGMSFFNPKNSFMKGPILDIVFNDTSNLVDSYIHLSVNIDFAPLKVEDTSVTVEYWEYDLAGNPVEKIAADKTLTGAIGDRYHAEISNISGFTFNGVVVGNDLNPISGLIEDKKK